MYAKSPFSEISRRSPPDRPPTTSMPHQTRPQNKSTINLLLKSHIYRKQRCTDQTLKSIRFASYPAFPTSVTVLPPSAPPPLDPVPAPLAAAAFTTVVKVVPPAVAMVTPDARLRPLATDARLSAAPITALSSRRSLLLPLPTVKETRLGERVWPPTPRPAWDGTAAAAGGGW